MAGTEDSQNPNNSSYFIRGEVSSSIDYLKILHPCNIMNLKVIFRGKARLRQMTISKWEIGHLGGLTCLSFDLLNLQSDRLQHNLKFCWLQTGKFVVTTDYHWEVVLCAKYTETWQKAKFWDGGVTKNFLIRTLSDITRCCHCHSQLKNSHRIQQWQHLTRFVWRRFTSVT